MEASTLNCPMCGAASATDATKCEHCGARLATVACPSCFGLIFLGAKFCQHCGGKVVRVEADGAKPKRCPRCRIDLKPIALGWAQMHECAQCEGLWVDVETFNGICADREKQAVILGGASPNPQPAVLELNVEEMRYVPCPECGKLMNRVSFAHGAGIIVDVCKGHGTWFDRDELRRIVEFIRGGGLEKSRDRDREAWETERRRKLIPPASGSFDAARLDDGYTGSWGSTIDVLDVLFEIGRALARLLSR